MSKMLSIREVKLMLGLSYESVIELVQDGQLRAYRYAGGTISREEVQPWTKGLRFREHDVEELIESSLVK